MTDFFLNTLGVPTNPKPESKQHGNTTDYGVYEIYESGLVEPTSGEGSKIDFGTYGLGIDDALHWSEPVGFITPPLATQTLNGAWSCLLGLTVNAVPPTVIWLRASAQLWLWGANDAIKTSIGTEQTIGVDLTTTQTDYTLTFTASQSVAIADGDRLYMEVWSYIRDSSAEGSVLINRIRINDSTNKSKIVTPGTAQLFVPKMTSMAMCGVGI